MLVLDREDETYVALLALLYSLCRNYYAAFDNNLRSLAMHE